MYSNEQIFIWDYEKLNYVYNNPSESNLVEASVCLRRLLLDRPRPLIHKVNDHYKIKLYFYVAKNIFDKLPPAFSPTFAFSNPSAYHPQLQNQKLNFREFLSHKLIIANGESLSVKDIINYVANIAGGVHAGDPLTIKENAISQLSESVYISDIPFPSSVLKMIIKVVLDSFSAIYLLIKRSIF